LKDANRKAMFAGGNNKSALTKKQVGLDKPNNHIMTNIDKLKLKLTKKEIEQRKKQQGGTLNYDNDSNFDLKHNKGFPEVDSYYEYKKLGGKKNRKQYFDMYNIFINETMDIFVFGDYSNSNYKSRDDALHGVAKKAKITIPELNRVFDSVNNITSYT
jgi:hypothetical protein